MTSPSMPDLPALQKAARAVAKNSYSPYSKFQVGASVLADSGKIYSGTNVENASYGLCICAERSAIFSAAAAGERRILCVVVYTPTVRPTLPCGACRQVINEFGPEARIVSICDSAQRADSNLLHLLPESFGPSNLAD